MRLVRTSSISLAASALGLVLAASNAAFAQAQGTETSSENQQAANPSANQPSEAQLQEARDQYREGVAAFRARRFGDATVAFERSFRIRPHPTTLYNEAEARFRAGDRAGAIEQLRQVLAMTDPAPDQQTVDHVRALAHEAGVDDLQPAPVQTGPSCPECPVCQPQRDCPPAPPPSTQTVSHGPLPYILAGGGLVFIAMGMTFYGYALGDANAYNHPSNTGQNPMLDAALAEQGNAFRIVGLTTFLIGLGLEGVAIWQYLRTPSAPAHPASRRHTLPIASAHIDVAPNGIVLSGTF
jgi:hypothetical protein